MELPEPESKKIW